MCDAVLLQIVGRNGWLRLFLLSREIRILSALFDLGKRLRIYILLDMLLELLLLGLVLD